MLLLVKKKDKKINLNNAKKVLHNILSGKINNKYAAEREFLEKI